MSKEWRNNIANEVSEKYFRARNNQKEAIRVSSVIKERNRSAKELEMPVDEFMNNKEFYTEEYT